jgi:hypothetical protein
MTLRLIVVIDLRGLPIQQSGCTPSLSSHYLVDSIIKGIVPDGKGRSSRLEVGTLVQDRQFLAPLTRPLSMLPCILEFVSPWSTSL